MRIRKKELRVFYYESDNLVDWLERKYFDHMELMLERHSLLSEVGMINAVLTNWGCFDFSENYRERLSADIYRGEWEE